MNFKQATLTELYTISAYEICPNHLKWQAAQEIIRRKHLTRKPYRNKQSQIKAVAPKW